MRVKMQIQTVTMNDGRYISTSTQFTENKKESKEYSSHEEQQHVRFLRGMTQIQPLCNIQEDSVIGWIVESTCL